MTLQAPKCTPLIKHISIQCRQDHHPLPPSPPSLSRQCDTRLTPGTIQSNSQRAMRFCPVRHGKQVTGCTARSGVRTFLGPPLSIIPPRPPLPCPTPSLLTGGKCREGVRGGETPRSTDWAVNRSIWASVLLLSSGCGGAVWLVCCRASLNSVSHRVFVTCS